MKKVKAKASKIADAVREKVKGAIEEVKAKRDEVAEEVKAQADVVYKDARKRFVSLGEEWERYVRQYPREVRGGVCAGFGARSLIRR